MTRDEAIDYIIKNHQNLICPIVRGLCYDECDANRMKIFLSVSTHEIAQEIQAALKLGEPAHTPNSAYNPWRWQVYGEQAKTIGPELVLRLRKKGTMEAHRRANFIEIALDR